jgi:hypothetical protein
MKSALEHLVHCCLTGTIGPECPILDGLAGADTLSSAASATSSATCNPHCVRTASEVESSCLRRNFGCTATRPEPNISPHVVICASMSWFC